MKKIDENYFKVVNNKKICEIEDVLEQDEHILWRDKPHKKSYVWSNFFSLLPIALIWLVADSFFIWMMISSGAFEEMDAFFIVFIIAFFLLHLMPVWIWISSVAKAKLEHKNIEYVFTEKRIIIRSGIIGIDIQSVYYSDIESVNLKVGLIDKIYKVGDVYLVASNGKYVLFDIKNPYDITSKLQKITLDIKADIYYPNAYRPTENKGYNTKYKG